MVPLTLALLVLGFGWVNSLTSTPNSAYACEVKWKEGSSLGWGEVHVSVLDKARHLELEQANRRNGSFPAPASTVISEPVYVSLTTIERRLVAVPHAIKTLLHGTMLPDMIFLFISKEPYLIDTGISTIPDCLLTMVSMKVLRIVYTKNIGPHRKLLPLLDYYWKQPAVIITVDDDMPYEEDNAIVSRLVHTYKRTGQNSIVALRARRLGVCASMCCVTPYQHWPLTNSYMRDEMLILPTGTGGVLYKPSFFHKIVFDEEFRQRTASADDLMFRLATMAMGVKVVLSCPQHATASPRMTSYEEFCLREHLQQERSDREKSSLMKNQTVTLPFRLRRLETSRQHLLPATKAASYQAKSASDTATTAVVSKSHRKNYAVEFEKSFERSRAKSLFSLNRLGLNDRAWQGAVNYLEEKKVLHMESLLALYYREREADCYQRPRAKLPIQCGVWVCSNSTVPTKKDMRSRKQ